MAVWETLSNYWHVITASVAAFDGLLVLAIIPWILSLKKETTSAVAWCLLVIFVPLFGAFLFVLFGYQSVHRPLKRKVRHRVRYRSQSGASPPIEASTGAITDEIGYEGLGRLATKLNASPPVSANRVSFFHDGPSSFAAVFEAIEAAKHHVHVEFFIFRYDRLGQRFLELLTRKAKEGVKVRLLTDGIGARSLKGWQLKQLLEAGGTTAAFLPVSLWRRKFQVNLRNHRKIVVVDGLVAFTGGLNVGDEYMGEDPEMGYWRDTFLRIEGPAVESLQRVFIEDWNFATEETVKGTGYFPIPQTRGDVTAQVIASGPDQELKSIREIYFAAILKAHERLWIVTPYYMPDQSIRDALCLMARSGIDVRIIVPEWGDHWITWLAGRYYLPELLDAGVKVYQYTKGFMHAKIMLVDGQWASVGSANLDNRSLLLNFEANCLFHTPAVVAELEEQFERDLCDSQLVDPKVYAKRPLRMRAAENFCRLFAPVL